MTQLTNEEGRGIFQLRHQSYLFVGPLQNERQSKRAFWCIMRGITRRMGNIYANHLGREWTVYKTEINRFSESKHLAE